MAAKSGTHDRAPHPDRIVTPVLRRRLQECYERGLHLTRKQPCDHDYAHTMFTECVIRDPGNVVYIEAMLENLGKKFHGNRKGSRLKAFVSRGPVKKAVSQEDWLDVLRLGPDLLRHNPWDVATLRALARACEHFRYFEAELRYLKNALDARPKDPEVNRHCALSLARMGQFDQAISCWNRVGEARPQDLEPQQQISQLTLEKNRARAGYPSSPMAAPSSSSPSPTSIAEPEGTAPEQTRPDATPHASDAQPKDACEPAGGSAEGAESPRREIRRSPQQQLEQALRQFPEDVESQIQLVQLYLDDGRFADAERTLRRGATISSDIRLQELGEECSMARARHQLAIAQQRAEAEKTQEAEELVEQIRGNLCRIELDVYDRRSQRYPTHSGLKLQLGIRLKRLGNYDQALAQFEQARQDEATRVGAAIEIGECLQHKRQYAKALHHYQQALYEAEQQELGPLKCLALYRAGVLAAGLKEWDTAERHLGALANEDPQFKDVRPRLDKVRQMRDKG